VDARLTSGIDWRQKLDSQRGAVLATELKNNSCKLAKWTLQAMLASADLIKLGYVSRNHARDNNNHVLLGTQTCKPAEFARQINLNANNAWGILKSIVDVCLKLDEGRYLLLKARAAPVASHGARTSFGLCPSGRRPHTSRGALPAPTHARTPPLPPAPWPQDPNKPIIRLYTIPLDAFEEEEEAAAEEGGAEEED